MGVRRRTLIVGFAMALFLGVAVYIRLWSMDSMDSSFTADDREILRRQFERANIEAMDESAEWRMMFDKERERSKEFEGELSKVKGALGRANEMLGMLRKENTDLRKQMETLKLKVETNQQRCDCNRTVT